MPAKRLALAACFIAAVAFAEDKPTRPLTELGDATYKGQSGGLYGEGKNEPPEKHAALAKAAIARITPRDAAGKPAADGRIALVSIGMSNTTQEFSTFIPIAEKSAKKDSHVVVVDGAQGGMDAATWNAGGARSPWSVLDDRLKRAGVSPGQVQAIWIKQALKGPARIGEMPKHTDALQADIEKTVLKAREKFPNLQVVYLSSRIYAGYARSQLNPEPYAYEGAFAVRDLILKQIKNDKTLNADPAAGEVKAPVLLWGPYLWANGETARKDGLAWIQRDFGADGTHPDEAGRKKVAEQLLTFFTTDPLAKPWFARK